MGFLVPSSIYDLECENSDSVICAGQLSTSDIETYVLGL